MMNGMMMGPGRILAAVDLPTLKTDLGITAAQEPQWATYEKAFTTLLDTRTDMQTSTQDLAMTRAERLDMRSAHWDATVDLRTDLQKARDGLVGVLSPEQITILNQKAPSLPLSNGPAR
ncbi:Spy/CpxP family protein refolding chaperone [Rhodospirillum rubrum]|uniref:Spy/CpxP family protein refolding chaperone n=1 Tax=Rhodospirillum rubrum TaxID=1085 RepID=UPI001F5BC903|nr:Spy/CpxP family protein refolding chaperone [Rhodospirillum rubrum]